MQALCGRNCNPFGNVTTVTASCKTLHWRTMQTSFTVSVICFIWNMYWEDCCDVIQLEGIHSTWLFNVMFPKGSMIFICTYYVPLLEQSDKLPVPNVPNYAKPQKCYIICQDTGGRIGSYFVLQKCFVLQLFLMFIILISFSDVLCYQ